ncbi:MAG: hypothetical protein A2751_04605 [Candidatus Doudnabacteria bacterium RIFCSPHIGHO2_01_FULL_46_14]|uniref:Nudix hydrolase domain-containing protein n=1 Tax=Candidatus Doudnabacteria bacterium RIFCSPHIGHO2_01_FULL_46_14 TaxID=1817824 RepID=A0A1F5NNU7_9BACT|nr:MAG: hypothetical protein A2751_04605 [Candidatus Doudnabacteria bacterium RIFCSPHIGHO2_01_FULL_46_14]
MRKPKVLKFINTSSDCWTPTEIIAFVLLCQKMRYCASRGHAYPPAVFEALCTIKKNLNIDIILEDNKGRVYLRRRPSRKKNPHEPFPGKLHFPGTTQRTESLKDAWQRLLTGELRGIEFGSDLWFCGIVEHRDKPRAICLSLLFRATVKYVPSRLRKHFYEIDQIPLKELVVSHRTVTLPYYKKVRRERSIREIQIYKLVGV